MNPAEALEHSLDVRQIALATLDENTLQPFQPYSKLRDLLPLVWLWHRYEVEVSPATVCSSHLTTPSSDADRCCGQRWGQRVSLVAWIASAGKKQPRFWQDAENSYAALAAGPSDDQGQPPDSGSL